MAASRTSRKLWWGFGGLSTVLVLSLLFIVVRLSAVNAHATLSSNALLRDDIAHQLEVDLAAYASVVDGDPSGGQAALQQAAVEAGKIEEGIATYDRLALTERQKDLAAELQSIWPKLKESGKGILLEKSPSDDRIAAFNQDRSSLEDLLRFRMQPNAAGAYFVARGTALRELRGLFRYALIVLSLAPLLALGVSFIVSRGVLREERTNAERAELLLKADQRRNEFLATLAHELRNPLASISLGVEIMKLTAGDPAKQVELREMLGRQTRQLVALVDDLMDVARITTGKLELRKQRLALAEIVRTAVEASQPVIASLSHQLTVTMPPEPIELDADPNRLAQVLSNLLNNAAKFTPQGGRIELAVSIFGDEAEICVSDNGIGIAPEAQANIFEMFAQGGHPLDKSHQGLGIGLTLAKQLVSMHGGSISVHSDGQGRGTEFRVRLPRLMEPPTEQVLLPLEAASMGGKRRILVVDDNKDAAEMLSALLETAGHDVRTVYGGEEALKVAEGFRPELVLMDLGMPGINGYEVARRLRSNGLGPTLTLVAVTGWGQDSDRLRSKEAGFDGHLVKPVSLEDIRGVLSKLNPTLA